MESQATTETGSVCDCCGRQFPGTQLSPAAAEPQMTVCDACQHHLDRESLDRARETASKVMRWLGNGVRGIVTRFELHETKLLGSVLRWMDRRSPW